MLNTLVWWKLSDPGVAGDIDALRKETLRFLVWLTAIGYVTWHSISSYQATDEGYLLHWRLFPIVASSLTITLFLERLKSPHGAASFLIGSICSISAAIGVFQTSLPSFFYPLVALTGVILLHPLAGLLVGAGSVGAMLLFWQIGTFTFVDSSPVVAVGVACALAVVVAWALGRNMVTAVEWALDGYQRALDNTRAAQIHRAELVKALKQLDIANYRLERANAALGFAWKAAEAAQRSRAEFVANISHELRTPLNLIVGFSEMMVTSPESYGTALPAAFRGDLNAIYRSAQHLVALTEDVLDLARVGMSRLALAREAVDLASVIGDAEEIVREFVTANGLWLKVLIAPDLPTVSVDRLRIRQILVNLLTNAVRFTNEGGITVSAAIEGPRIVVRVGDTGCGIAAEHLEKVFEEFYSSAGDKAPAHPELGGFGLGLPLSKRLVELHGGEMGVESAVGAGSVFWFTLPTVPVDGEVHDNRAHPIGFTYMPRGDDRVVVLAGADARMARFLQRHLRGCRVIPTPSWRRAVVEAVESRALAILADVDGVDLAVERDPPVPVVRLPLPHRERMAAALGAADYLVKPVTRAEVLAAVAGLGRPIGRALVVDDDPRFVRLISSFLRHRDGEPDAEIVAAHNGREALTTMESARPDVVLLDLSMPDLGGAEVLAAMAERPDLADVPVILISAWEQGEGLLLQGPLTVAKPDGFRLEEMLGSIETLLSTLDPPQRYLEAGSAGSPRKMASKRA